MRAWFNALAQNETIARGREAVEKLLQREGRTAMRLDDLAGRLGFKSADALFEVVGKDEFSLRNIETGVSVHRADCSNFSELAARTPERVISVAWDMPKSAAAASVYPVDVVIQASDRQGLLRDISEVFSKEKMNVIGVQTQSIKDTAWLTFTVEVVSAGRLNKVLGTVAGVKGVRAARRR